MTTRTIGLVTFLHDDESDYCPCSDCGVARDVVAGMTGIILDDRPGDFVLDEVSLPLP